MPLKKKDSGDPFEKWKKNRDSTESRSYFFKRKSHSYDSIPGLKKEPKDRLQKSVPFDNKLDLEFDEQKSIKKDEDIPDEIFSSKPKPRSIEKELPSKEIEIKKPKSQTEEFPVITKRTALKPYVPNDKPVVKPLNATSQPYLVGEAKKPPISIKPTGPIDISKMRDLVLEDLEQENIGFQQENQRLKQQNDGLKEEAENQLELIAKLKKTYQQATLENQRLAREKETLMDIREKLSREKKGLEDEVSLLKGEKTNIVQKFQKLEVDISDFKDKHEEMKDKFSGELKEKLSDVDAMRQMLEAKKLEAMKLELEVDRLTKDNDELKFKAGLLDQKLSLKKLGLARDEDLQDDAFLQQKANKAVLELSARINKLEENYKLKEIEYKARLQVYKKAMGSPEKQGKMMAIEDLEVELRKKNDEIKANTILIQDLERQIASGTVPTGVPRDHKKSIEMSAKIVDLEKILTEQGLDLSDKTMLINDLRSQLADSIEKITKFESELQTLSSKAKASEQQIDAGALNELMLKMTQMRTPESELEKRLQEYGAQITQLYRDNDMLNAQLADLYDKLGELGEIPSPPNLPDKKMPPTSLE